jgi:hypothetical protein
VVLAAAASALVLLHGTVTIGPTSPVCHTGTPCTKPAAGIVIEFFRDRHIALARTDAKGRYSRWLTPGTWTVRATRGVRITPAKIIVRAVATQRRDFAIDTGIR